MECSQDNYQTTHAYPRSTEDSFTPTNAVFDGVTGYLTITSNGHGLDEGSLVKIDDNAITLRCTMDGSLPVIRLILDLLILSVVSGSLSVHRC